MRSPDALRLIGVASLKRAESLPDVPTMSEAGVAGFEVLSWYGLLAPAGTPADIVQRLNHEITRGLNETDSLDRIKTIRGEPARAAPEEFNTLFKKKKAEWGQSV